MGNLVGLVGWRGMVGSVLMDRMQAEGDFNLIEPLFFSTSNAGGKAPAQAKNETTLQDAFNIDALKRVGCTDILAISAVGSLQEDYAPGDFVAVDQFIDRTKGRPSTFFETGLVGHVPMADPVCPRLTGLASDAGIFLACAHWATVQCGRLTPPWRQAISVSPEQSKLLGPLAPQT